MFEDIKKNKMKTYLIVGVFLVMITLIVYFICMAFDLGIISIIIALLVSILSAFISYYNSDKIILSTSGANPASPEDYQALNNILDGLMISSGLKARPKLYVIEDQQPNAFATGRDPEHAIVCVTRGLLNTLEYYELEAVLAHELSHIKNYDILLSTVISVMVGLVVILSDFVVRIMFRSGRRSSSSKNSGSLEVIFLLLGLVCLILSPIFATLIQLAVSRRREYLADANAIEFTRNPDALVSALTKITSSSQELASASKSTAHLYISSPFKKKNKTSGKSSLWSTHPTLEERVNAIQNIR